jgi:hypothetical protein
MGNSCHQVEKAEKIEILKRRLMKPIELKRALKES